MFNITAKLKSAIGFSLDQNNHSFRTASLSTNSSVYFHQDPAKAHRALARCRAAVLESRYDDALLHVLAAICAYPGWAPVYAELAKVLSCQGREAEAHASLSGGVDRGVWAAQHPDSLERTTLQPTRLVQRLAVKGLDQQEVRLLAPQYHGSDPDSGPVTAFKPTFIKPSELFVDIVANGFLWHDAHNTCVYDCQGCCVQQHTVGNQHVVDTLRASHQPQVMHGRVFVLGARGISNYFHWMTDVIPKLYLCQQLGIEFNTSDRFVVPFLQRDFQMATLSKWGIVENQIYQTHLQASYLRVEELVVPYLRNHLALRMGRWLPQFLQSLYSDSIANRVTADRLYVSRNSKQTHGRWIANLSELEHYLHQQGFSTIYPEQLSIENQAALFANASVVVGPHGAALTNIVHCRRATKVIELYGAHIAPCYWAISALIGLEYYALKCPEEESFNHSLARQVDAKQRRKHQGFRVEVTHLESLFAQAGVIDQSSS